MKEELRREREGGKGPYLYDVCGGRGREVTKKGRKIKNPLQLLTRG